MKVAIWIARVLIAALFVYAGAVKAGASEEFAVAIAGFGLLDPAQVDLAAQILPFVEIVAGILILIPKAALAGSLLIAGLLSVFASAIVWALANGLVIDCGCFGEGVPSITQMQITLARNLALLALTLGLAARRLPRDP